MNVIARSVRSTAWIVADSWISAALGAVSYLFLIRILGPEIFGTIAIAGLFFGAVGTFVGSALTESIQQREEVETGHLNMTFWLNSSLCFVLAGLIAAAAVPIGALFGSEALTKVIPALALAALISSFGALPRALLERKLQHDKLAALNALAGIPSTIVALGMAWYGFGVWSLVGSILTGTCLGTLGVWLMVDWRPGLAMERRHFTDLVDFNRNTVLTNALGYADDAIPRFTLAIVAGERAVGLFDLAMQISSTLSSAIMGPIGEVAMNTIARLQSREDHVRELLHRVFTLTTSIMYPAVLGVVVVAPFALPLVLGEAWLDVVLPAQLALLIGLRNASGDLNIAILRGFGESSAPVRILGIGAVLQILFTPLIIAFGTIGAVVAVALRVFATWPISAMEVHRVCKYGMMRQVSVGLPALMAAAIMTVATWGLAIVLPQGWPSLLMIGVVVPFGVAVYGACLVLGRQVQRLRASVNWFRVQMRTHDHQAAVAV